MTAQGAPVVLMRCVDCAHIPLYVARDLLPHEHDRRTLNSHGRSLLVQCRVFRFYSLDSQQIKSKICVSQAAVKPINEIMHIGVC